jgi:hypothetical protein
MPKRVSLELPDAMYDTDKLTFDHNGVSTKGIISIFEDDETVAASVLINEDGAKAIIRALVEAFGAEKGWSINVG